MNRYALAIALLLTVSVVSAGQRMVEGVPWDAVDWETLCKNVKPLTYKNPNGQVCPKVHPADSAWRKRKPERKWRCEALAKSYEQKTKTVGACRSAFAASLRGRARDAHAYDEPFKVWRARYFGPWIQGD